jgi:hypothetical protein
VRLAEVLTAEGEGRAAGAQLTLRRAPPSGGGFFGWVSYGFGVAERRASATATWRPADFDRRHLWTLVVGFADEAWSLSLRARGQRRPVHRRRRPLRGRDPEVVFGHRVRCGVPRAPTPVAAAFERAYIENAAPRIDALGFDGLRLQLTLAPEAAERYARLSPAADAVEWADERLSVAWRVSRGTLASARADVEGGAAAVEWADGEGGTAWAIVRDERGGVAVAELRR